MNTAKTIATILAIGCASATGCAQESDAGSTKPAEDVTTSDATLLASVTLDQGQVVNFMQAKAGFVFLAETGPLRQTPRIAGLHAEGRSLSDVYRALAPNAEVPRALLDAERNTTPVATEIAYAPADSPAHGEGPAFYTSGEQTWFRQTFCPGADKCIQAWDWIDSGWDYTTSWKSTAMIGSEGAATVLHQALYWRCSGGACDWAPFYSVYTAPGHYSWITGGGLFYYKARFSGAGAGTQVSMAINDAPTQCAHCNDGSCQCGHVDRTTLCSAHGGETPGIGCIVQP